METVNLDDSRRDAVTAALAECPLFRALKADHFPQILKVAETVSFAPDEVIVKQGEPSDSFFVLVQGEAAVRAKGPAGAEVDLGRIPMPSTFGEIGLLLGEPRTASVVARNDVLALKFGAKAFDAMFQKIPNFGLGLSSGLAFRLQQLSGKVPLPSYDAGKGRPKSDVLALLPMEMVQRHRVLPLEVDGKVLTVGLVDDPSSAVLGAIQERVPSLDLNPVRIDAGYFNEVLQGHAGVEGWSRPGAAALTDAPSPRSPKLDKILERMVAEGASDVHLSAGHRPHWRVDGDMRAIADLPVLGPSEVFDLVEPIMEPRHRDAFLADSDADLAYNLPGVSRFRVNVFRDRAGVGAVFRQIPSNILSLEQLGMPPVLRTLCEIPKGLILVTGPTGSGKSTTLAAMIDHINNTMKSHIITLEDPIEFVHASKGCLVNQREVGGHTKTFARALKAALREDPDIVLVGELRDLETIALALETANTGHLVFATLHTNTAISAVDRIVDMFPGDQQEQIRTTLADVLRGVVAQTLCKKVGGGRIAALEILLVNLAVSNLIREEKTVQIPSIMQSQRALGMSLLNDELARMIEAKKITMEEAVTKAVDKEDLVRRFRSGLTIAADPPAFERFRVMAITPDSPAALAGLQRGDLILEIDGKPAKEYDLDQARSVFRTDGKHVLTLERSGKRLTKVPFDLVR